MRFDSISVHESDVERFISYSSESDYGESAAGNSMSSKSSHKNTKKDRKKRNAKKDKLTKHETYVEDLILNIKEEYDNVLKNVKFYSGKKKLLAEADIVGIKGDCADIYEVKCSYRIVKAKKQLRRLKRILSKDYNIRTLYFYPANVQQLVVLKL